MGGGLTFLSKKGFNPANIQNQKNVWEARQRVKRAQEESEKRTLQLKQEREEDELAKSRFGNNQLSHKHSTLKFMYNAPPGLEKKNNVNNKVQLDSVDDGSKNDSSFQSEAAFEPQPGDDEAAAQFRLLLSNQLNPNQQLDQEILQNEPGGNDTNNSIDNDINEKDEMKKDNIDTRTHLEKAVGKAASQSQAISLEMQIARFPQLKNAPVVKGMNPSNINVQFKPMGAQPIRHIRCLKCGVWGHSRGDRECKLSGWDPFHTKFVTDKDNAPEKIKSNDDVSNKKVNGIIDEITAKDRRKEIKKSHRSKNHVNNLKKSSEEVVKDNYDDMSRCTKTSVSSNSYSTRSLGSKKYDRKEKNRKRRKRDRNKCTRYHSHRRRRRDGDRDRDRGKRKNGDRYKHESKKRKRRDSRDRGKDSDYFIEDTRKEKKLDRRTHERT